MEGGPQQSAPGGGPVGAGGENGEHEPVVTGTLFIVLVFLMALAAMWAIMYRILLDR